MARKSRKHLQTDEPQKLALPCKYTAGGYVRVSNKSRDSIENQKLIIQGYVDESIDISLKRFYVDDGVSSFFNTKTSFNEMIADIEEGIINCIIVKDASRFTRDDLEAGAYIQKHFPKYNARFISINDNFDSHQDAMKPDFSFMVRHLLNYAYSKDISAKVKSVIKQKQELGEYIGATLPYGYKKQNINGAIQYTIDNKAAEVVRNIFLWAAQGDSSYIIAGRLNNQVIPSPGIYRKLSIDDMQSTSIWSSNSVTSILRNEIYTGCLVMRKSKTESNQMRKPIKIEKEEWLRFADHHVPIIDQGLFINVQKLLDYKKVKLTSSKHKPSEYDYLGNRLFCGDCGRKMKNQRVNGFIYYICPRYSEAKNGCTAKRISESELLADIYESILLEIERIKACHKKQLEYEKSFAYKIKNNHLREQIIHLSKNISDMERALRNYYEDSVQGFISQSDYMLIRAYNDKGLIKAQTELSEAQTELNHFRKRDLFNCLYDKSVLEYDEAEGLSKDMYNSFVKNVLVRDSGVEVEFLYSMDL